MWQPTTARSAPPGMELQVKRKTEACGHKPRPLSEKPSSTRPPPAVCAVDNAVANIETLLLRGEIVETTDAIMLRAARRALEKRNWSRRQ